MKEESLMERKKGAPIPVVSIIILVACTVVGVLQLIKGDSLDYRLAMYQGAMRNGEYYRAFSCAFIHYGIDHFFWNMLCAFLLGRMLEFKIGPGRYAIIYLAGIIGSSLLIEFVGGTGNMHGGASGAIWGLMGATLICALKNHEDKRGILRMILFNLIYTFVTSGISWQGHIGGLAGGTVVSLLIIPKYNQEAAYDRYHHRL